MTVAAAAPKILRFGIFEVDLGPGELRKQGKRIKLQEQPLQVLAILLERPGAVVAREDLRLRIWPQDTFVDFDNSLNTAMSKLREALGDSASNPRFIETLPRRGYRFIAVVSGDDHKKPSMTAGRSKTATVVAVALLIAATLAVALTAAYWNYSRHSPRTKVGSIAVLPLDNLSGDPSEEYFVDGMTDALITELGKMSALRVISRQSIMQYKGSKKPLSEIARDLNIDAVLEGTVERSGDRVRVILRLDQVSPEGQLWSNQYNRDIRDLLRLQDEITRAVTDEIQVKLTPEERTRPTSAHSVDPEAHDDYLRGRYLLGLAPAHSSKFAEKRQFTEPDIQKAIGHFKQAIEKDPAYASAYAGLADAYITLGNPVWGGHSPRETLSDAKAAATKALELDPSLAEAHFSLAQTFQYDWNWSEAEKEYRLALKLNPNYADAHLEYGRFVQALGRNDEAMTQMNYAIELDPFSIKTREVVAYVTYASRQYDLAVKQFESLGDDFGLMWAYREKEMYPEAIAAWQRWKLSHPSQRRHPHPLAVVAGIYGLEGRKREAQALIDELRETARHRYVSGFFFAEAYVGLGEKDQALTSLERAYEEHDQWMVFVNSYPGFDRLRSEPRFQALVRRMNFPQ